MDAFENIVAGLLWQEGYWTYVGYKVELSKKAKKRLKNDTMPRPEIDILAYRARDNSVIWVECKSYMDSRGVKIEALTGEDERNAARYKVFTRNEYRKEVTSALKEQLLREGRVSENPSFQYCLVTGHIALEKDRDQLRELFQKNGWILYDERWVQDHLKLLAEKGYENDVAIQVAKLFAH